MERAASDSHWRIYDDFIRDLRHNNDYSFIKYIEDYNEETVMKLCPSQHQFISSYQQTKITESWVEFLKKNILPVTEMQVCTLMNQKVFDAVCNQVNLESLRIKWLKGKNISNITKLTNLRKLFIENGTQIEDISPLLEMKQLEVLILGNTKKIHDYSCLSQLQNLKVLGICKYQSDYSSCLLQMDSDEFLKDMPNLEWVDLVDCKLKK